MATKAERELGGPIAQSIRERARHVLRGDRTPGEEHGWLKSVEKKIGLLYWLADHCAEYSTLPVHIAGVKSDLIGLMQASTLKLERTIYLCGRSTLEGLVRHIYYDAHPALFVSAEIGAPDRERDWWGDLRPKVMGLAAFATARMPSEGPGETGASGPRSEYDPFSASGGLDLHGMLKTLYAQSSGFIHVMSGKDGRMKHTIDGFEMTAAHVKMARAFIDRLYDTTVPFLALYHLGPYLLASQPIRRYVLEQMSTGARESFIESCADLSMGWVEHQRRVALATTRGRREYPKRLREGLLMKRGQGIQLVLPAALR